MRKITLSLALLALVGVSAQADMKNLKFGGTASLFYETNDAKGGDLFNKGQSMGNVGVHLGGTSAVGSCDTCVKLNYGVTGVSTMGLEHTLVDNTWVGQSVSAHGTAKPFLGGADINDGVWIDTLNLSFMPLSGISNTTMVVGRQALDTPMVFTEKWNIAQNTFDSVVAVNTDIVDTTLVGAWVGRSNGRDVVDRLNDKNDFLVGDLVHTDGISDNAYNRFLTDEGAYAFGAVTKAIPGVTAQGWYYIAPNVANVAWLQADTSYAGFGLGAQYVYTDPDGGSTGNGFAVKLGYDFNGFGINAAYSSTDEKLLTAANLDGAQSKLYTESWWTYGEVSQKDTDSYSVSATYDLKDVAGLGVFYTHADHKAANSHDFDEIAVTADKKLGNLDVTLAYVNHDYDGDVDKAGKEVDAVNEVQAYFTYNF